jgi:hypothetical protein
MTETSLADDNCDVMTMFDRVHVTCRDSAKLRFRAGSSSGLGATKGPLRQREVIESKNGWCRSELRCTDFVVRG